MCVEDSGREIEIIAGVKSSAASSVSRKSSKLSSSAAALFEVIEDIEQQPFMTPLYVTFPVYFGLKQDAFVSSNSLGLRCIVLSH